MKKPYVMNYITLGLLVISVSLSGMERNDIQLTELNFALPLTTIKRLVAKKVFLVSDNNNQQFVLKFQQNSTRAIADTLGAEIGKNKVDINQIQIFPSDYFTKKLNDPTNLVKPKLCTFSSTLHTFIEGYALFEYSPIKRAIQNKNQLKEIATHKELGPMVALNIYVNNHDCHGENLLYNSKTEKYSLIDMDLSFKNLTNQKWDIRLTKETIEFLRNYHIYSTKQAEHLQALRYVNKTLGELIEEYPPQKSFNLFVAISQRVNKNYDKDELERLFTEFKKYYNETQDVYNEINNLIKD